MGQEMNLPWCTHLTECLAEVNVIMEMSGQETEFVAKFIQRLQTSHREEWAYNVQTTSKLDSFARYKTELKMSEYLSHIANPMHRTMFDKIRTTNHSLEIELGRHRNIPSVRARARELFVAAWTGYVGYVTGLVETELHFLLECSAYEDLRHQLFCEIAFVDPRFYILVWNKLLYI